MSQQISSRRDIEEHLAKRAMEDEAFLSALRENPKAAVEQELANLLPGFIQLPSSMEIKLLEETPSTLYLVLPPRPPAEDGALSDSQLEAVAGGVTVVHNYNAPPEFPTQNFGPNTMMGVKGQLFHDAGWLYTAPNNP